jgi:hypothetical protein
MPASSEYVSRNAYNINVGNFGPVAAFVGKAIHVTHRLGPKGRPTWQTCCGAAAQHLGVKGVTSFQMIFEARRFYAHIWFNYKANLGEM